MTATRSRLLAASLTVIALALAGQAAAQETPSAPPGPEAHPPAIILAPGQSPQEATPGEGDPQPEATAAPDDAPAPPAIPLVWAPIPTEADGGSAYGLYLAGKLALMQGEGAAGADYLARTFRLTPEQPRVREQAFTSALLSGDMDVAAQVAPTGPDASPTLVEAGRLVRAAQDLARGDAEDANALLSLQPIGQPHARAGLMIAPWIAAAAGDWDRALQAPPAADPLTSAFARLNRALLLEKHRDFDEAGAELKALSELPTVGPIFRKSYGAFLERRGRRDEALALYEAAMRTDTADLTVARALERVRRGGRPPAVLTFREGAAYALSNAAAQASAERGHEFAAVYLRLALNLDPQPETRVQLAQVLSRAGLNAASREALEKIGPQDPLLYGAARLQLALSLQEDDQPEAALAELRRAAAVQPDDARIAFSLAAQLMGLERYDEALALLNGPLLNTADQPAQVKFLRGAAYESVGRIPEAEAELWAALQADPDNADFLNYLGYLWVDRDLRVQQGAEMIQRAFAADPQNGNIQDSLGWAQYRQGDYQAAVDTLEQAIDKEPANAEINDHLGDAYWRVGRRREAEWMWKRVLVLDPDEERRAEVERKIEQGLDAGAATGGVSQ